MSTPLINAAGAFVLKTPFIAATGGIYKCESIVGFEVLDANSIDVYETYYKPHGIAESVYASDRLNGVNIVTLLSNDEATIIIPDSFILDFPHQLAIPYNQTFLVFDLGLLPDEFILTEVQDYCEAAITAFVGVDSTSEVVVHPVIGTVDYSMHERLTNARLAAVAGRDNHYKAYEDEKAKNQLLIDRVAMLEAELDKYI